MDPQDHVPTNGRPPALQPPNGRRHDAVISLLAQRCEALRRGVMALKAENTELRRELRRLDGGPTPSHVPQGRDDESASWEVALPVGRQAPRAARRALADWLQSRVPQR